MLHSLNQPAKKISILMKINCSLSCSQKPTTGPLPGVNTTHKLFLVAIRIYCLSLINTKVSTPLSKSDPINVYEDVKSFMM